MGGRAWVGGKGLQGGKLRNGMAVGTRTIEGAELPGQERAAQLGLDALRRREGDGVNGPEGLTDTPDGLAEAVRIEGDIPRDLDISQPGKRFLFISRDQRAYTHGLHKYPAKFFPELPRWIIERYSRPGELVLDPFMGSGTTNLEAMLLGRPSVGVDIDPFSRFLARVKTTPLEPGELRAAVAELTARLDGFDADRDGGDIPEFPYRDNWFKPYVLRELAYIKGGIAGLACSQAVKDFLLAAFSSVIRRASQADNNCTRTVIRKKLDKRIEPGYAISLFRKRMEGNVAGMLALAERAAAAVTIPTNCSATDLAAYPDGNFDLALTSPPYLNAVDYPRTHQLEMYWLGLAAGSLRDLKRQHVGTEVVTAAEYAELQQTGIASADGVIGDIFAADPRRAGIAYRYVQDMVKNLAEVNRVLKPGGKYVLVVGSNMMRGRTFETWRYLREAAPGLGYRIETWFVSGIINHFIKVPRAERIEDDCILVLEKRGG